MSQQDYNKKLEMIKSSSASVEIKTNAIKELEKKYNINRHEETVIYSEIKMGEV